MARKKTYKVKVFDGSRMSSSTWRRFKREVGDWHKRYLGVRLSFDRERVKLDRIVVGKPRRVISEKSGRVQYRSYPNKAWFRRNFTNKAKGYDFCFAIVSGSQWRKTRKNNSLSGQSIDLHNGVSENFVVARRKRYQLDKGGKKYRGVIGITIHEFGHSWADHILKRPDLDFTHLMQYKAGKLSTHFKVIKRHL